MNAAALAPLPKVRIKKAGMVSDAVRALLVGRKYIPAKEMAKIRHVITDTGYAKTQPYLTQGGMGRGIFRNLFGDGPNRGAILKARLQQGGLFGKGGVLHGDMAFDPALFESIKKFKAGDRSLKNVSNIALEGGTGLMNVGFTAGLPLMTAAAALRGDASGGDVASEGLSTIGQALGAPFGIVGALGGGAVGTSLAGLLSKRDDEDIKRDLQKQVIIAGKGLAANKAAQGAKHLQGYLGVTPDTASFGAPEPEIYLPQ
jgi:hypothetical protein